MNKTLLRRTITAGAATSIALAGATLGAPASHAETVGPATGSSDAVDVSRSVSSPALVDGKIAQGSTITIENKVERKLAWLVYWVKDTHPSCLVPVDYSSIWKVSGSTYSNDPTSGNYKPNEFTSGDGWSQIKPWGANSWAATPLVWPQQYTVTCAPGELATGGLEWDSTWAFESGNKQPNLGPTITVVESTGPGTNPNPDTGDGSLEGSSGDGSLGTGSLGSLFG